MALFNRRNKKNNEPQDEDLDEFAIVDDEDDIFSSESPALDYDDDLDDDELDDYLDGEAEKSDETPKNEPVSKLKFIGIVAVAVVILFFILNALGVFDTGESDNSSNGEQTQSQEENSSDDQKASTGEGIVVNEAVGESYSGNDNGNPVNGTGAILAFTYDYYTSRNGEKAREHFNPEASSYDAAYIQNNIDNNPEGTSYSIKVTPRVVGSTYDGELTVRPPGSEKGETFNILYEVMEKDGVFYIKTFEQSSSSEQTR